MIDAREELVSAPAGRQNRRNAPAAAAPKGGLKSVTRGKLSRVNEKSSNSLKVDRVFSDAKVKPFEQIEWDKRTAEITDDSGKVIFKQDNVEVPKSWSLLATKVVV